MVGNLARRSGLFCFRLLNELPYDTEIDMEGYWFAVG